MQNIVKYTTGKNLESDVYMIFGVICHYNYDSLRCHELARIFCNVLKRYSYNVIIVDGFFIDIDKERKILHSWVESEDLYETKIVETTPQQVFPQLFSENLIRSLVISEDDERFTRYYPLPSDKFLELCKIDNIQIDENQVKHLSEMIFQAIEKTTVKKKKENK